MHRAVVPQLSRGLMRSGSHVAHWEGPDSADFWLPTKSGARLFSNSIGPAKALVIPQPPVPSQVELLEPRSRSIQVSRAAPCPRIARREEQSNALVTGSDSARAVAVRDRCARVADARFRRLHCSEEECRPAPTLLPQLDQVSEFPAYRPTALAVHQKRGGADQGSVCAIQLEQQTLLVEVVRAQFNSGPSSGSSRRCTGPA